MYPFLRMTKELWKFRKAPPLAPWGTHVSHHLCWPWDLDMWNELNNGRTLTLYDLGRIPMAHRVGLIRALRQRRWGLSMAGAMVRYRRRIRSFDRIEMWTRPVCWDNRFLYLEQSMWRSDRECANHIVYRAAIVSDAGIVPPQEVARAMGLGDTSPDMPHWIAQWCASEAARPWPPMQDSFAQRHPETRPDTS